MNEDTYNDNNMVDTIKGYIMLKGYQKNAFDELTQNSSTTIRQNTITKTFNLSNMKITISYDPDRNPKKLSFNGSLPKFYYGNNLQHLDWDNFKKAIQMLSDNLNVDMNGAILTRVDFGINISVNFPVHEYISCLLSYPRLKTIRYDESVTFFTTSNCRSFIFYDKLKELNKSYARTKIVSNKPTDENILRYEIQLKSNIKHRFRLKRMRIKHLYRDTVQNKLIEYWYYGYKKVVKIPLGIDPEHLFKNHNGIYKYLSYHGLERIGYDRLLRKIALLRFNLKDDRVKRSRMRKIIKDILKEVRDNALDKHLIDELDLKIETIKLKLLSNEKK